MDITFVPSMNVEDHAPLRDVTVPAVVAAMIAVVAEHEPGYFTTSNRLHSPAGSCIQGAMMSKLGFPFQEGADYSGVTETVLAGLGFGSTRNRRNGVLHAALAVAQTANDQRLPWTAALEAFERVMAGEPYAGVTREVAAAAAGLGFLRRRGASCPCGIDHPEMKTAYSQKTISWNAPYFAEEAQLQSNAAKLVLADLNKAYAQMYQSELSKFAIPSVV